MDYGINNRNIEMNETKDEKSWNELYIKYPGLFSNKNKDIKSSCMAWGCECGEGWYDLVSSVCWMIMQHEENIKSQTKWKQDKEPEYINNYCAVKFDQIKEKFGGLRIYFSGGDDYVEGLVSMAEGISYKICEVCGNKGKPNEKGWIRTLCENCKNKSF